MVSVSLSLLEAYKTEPVLLAEKFLPASVPWYRGTNYEVFGQTDTEGGEKNYHQRGPGWYFTTNRDDAASYGKLHEFRLSPKARILTDRTRYNTRTITEMVLSAPDVKETMWDWDPLGEGNVNRGLRAFLETNRRYGMYEACQYVMADFYKNTPDDFVKAMARYYDAYVTEDIGGSYGSTRHMVVYNKDVLTSVAISDVEGA